jgi:hypothetical protein
VKNSTKWKTHSKGKDKEHGKLVLWGLKRPKGKRSICIISSSDRTNSEGQAYIGLNAEAKAQNDFLSGPARVSICKASTIEILPPDPSESQSHL